MPLIHTPFCAIQPEPRSIPPANVEVDVFETMRLVTVLVPRDKPPLKSKRLGERVIPVIVPPIIVGLLRVVFES